jgi:hypothetical protein
VSVSDDLRAKLFLLAEAVDVLLDLHQERAQLAPALRADQAQIGMPLEFDVRADRAIRAADLEAQLGERSEELRLLASEVIQRLSQGEGGDREGCLALLALLTREAVYAKVIVQKLREPE